MKKNTSYKVLVLHVDRKRVLRRYGSPKLVLRRSLLLTQESRDEIALPALYGDSRRFSRTWDLQRGRQAVERPTQIGCHEFSTKSLREFVVKTLEEVVESRLIPLLNQAAKSAKVLDLQDVLRRFAFDTAARCPSVRTPIAWMISRTCQFS
ncbi:hypothetical protein HAX54_009540 [Datura stramonium]|uniref:Uncharacterized protein n=1 Tax=Datura stramonium TaxID=4076 RepID=A0ABS8RW94_DATST|nr:hypothetical protein [Datura stramonium]